MEGKFNPEKLKITEFKISRGNIDVPDEFDSELIKKFDSNMSFDALFSASRKSVRAKIGFKIETESAEEQKEAKAEFIFVYDYSVENLDELLAEDKEDVNEEEKTLLTSIAAISFSTSRGILLTRLQGTVMKDYILPIIKPVNLLKLD